MTLLEQIIKTSTKPLIFDEPLKYPISISPDSIFSTLKVDPQFPNPDPVSLLNPLTGFQISKIDSSIIELNTTFFIQLQHFRTIKSPPSSLAFVELLTPFLEKIGTIKFGALLEVQKGTDDYACNLIARFGSFVGKDVMGLVIKVCFLVENWKILQTLIGCKLVDYEQRSDLLSNLVLKKRSDLICLCFKHYRDMKASDLFVVLKYFLSPSNESLVSMLEIRKEWEREAAFAIGKATDERVSGSKQRLAKDVALIYMVAYDGFSSWELCLHYLVSSSVDDVVFSSAISKLSVDEMLGLIRYLGKWVRKYEKFPKAGLGREAAATLGMYSAQWVPSFENVVKCLGLVVDEHFLSLAMHSEFRNELKAIEEIVSSLALEGKLCCSVANLIDILKPDVKAV